MVKEVLPCDILWVLEHEVSDSGVCGTALSQQDQL